MRVGVRRVQPIARQRPLPDRLDRVVEIHPCVPCRPGRVHPHGNLLRRPLEGRSHVRHRSVVAEQQPGGRKRGELRDRPERDLEVEVRCRRRRTQVSRFRDVDPGRVADVQVAAGRVDQPDVVPRVPGGVVALQSPPVPEVDHAHVGQRAQPVGVHRDHGAEEHVERVPVHHSRARHQPRRVGQVPRSLLMHHDLRAAEHLRDVPDAAGVVEVDVRDHDRGQVVRPDPERGERRLHHRSGGGRPRLHQARPT